MRRNFVRLGSLRSFVVNSVAFVISLAALAALQPSATPTRIISLIPAVTEMLFAIGAGPQVMAVGSFDRYPPEVEKLQRVGALIDPDVERILSLRPDLVAIYGSQADLRIQLERAKVPVLRLRPRRAEGRFHDDAGRRRTRRTGEGRSRSGAGDLKVASAPSAPVWPAGRDRER